MKRWLRLFFWLVLSTFFAYNSVAAANDPDGFQVEVEPSTFQTNQAVDFTIKAIKKGAVMKDADFWFFITVVSEQGTDEITYADYVVPNDGYGTFTATDQGVKKFSKGLMVRKPGTYQLKIETFAEKGVSGSTIIIVHSEQDQETHPISIVSPTPGNIETLAPIDLIATVAKLPNTRIQIFLNNKMLKETISSSDGTISDTLEGMNSGNNLLQLKAFSIENKEVWISEVVSFQYAPLWDRVYKTIEMTPNTGLKLWDRVRFDLTTDERVSSAKMLFSSGKEYPMERKESGHFVKEVMLLNTWDIVVGLQLIVLEEVKDYPEALQFKVSDHIKIGEVKLQITGSVASSLNLAWKVLWGTAPQFAVFYGTGKDQLSGTLLTPEPSLNMTGLTYGKRYFFQIQALNEALESEGLPSEVVEFDMPIPWGTVGPDGKVITENPLEHEHPMVVSQPLCVVKNINFETKKIWSHYYMVRDAVENVEKYQIYRSDIADESAKKLVGEVTIPRFEYPFDTTVTGEVYAYYHIEAICKDGEKLTLLSAEKVQVGPMEDLLLILAATLLIFFFYRLYTYNKY